MRKFTLIFTLLVAMVTTAMAQKAHQRVSHDGWVVTALNEAGVYGNEGGVAFIADDNAATFYHSNWSSNYTDGNGVNKGKDGLQAFMVELPASLSDLSLITYKGRSDNNTSGWARGVRVYVFETLPEGWPAGGLSSLGYQEKETLLSKENSNLGTAAFDNTAKLWANDRTQKLVEFATPQTGKYVLFIMESGNDLWLTCADFQIYQLKDYTAIKENNPYLLQVTNAAAEGNQFIDTKTANADNQGLSTVAISTTSVETYFKWAETAWNISTNENVDGNYVGVTQWCAPPLQDTATDWHLMVNDDNTLTFFQGDYDGGSDNSRCFLGGDVTTNATVTKLYTDNAKDKAINVKLIDASAVPVTVKYSFTWNGVEKYTQTTKTFGGELYPDVNVELPYGIAAAKPDGEIDASEAVDGVITKTIVLESTLPFAFADSYEKINKWYYIQMHSSGGTYSRFLQYAETYIEWADVTRTISENVLYTWGFIGDPFTGFKLVNYGAPADANAVVSASDSGNPGFGTIADAVVWSVKASRTNPDSEHFCFQYPGSSNYMNAQSGKVSFWGDNDQGSTMWVTERDMTGATDLQELVDAVDAVSASYQGAIGTDVGNLTEESVTAVASALAAAKNTLALDDRTPEQISDAHIALQAAIDGLVTVQPKEGEFYTIASACTGGREGKMIYVNTGGGMNFNTAGTDLGYLFQFEAAGDGKFYMYNVAKDRYLSTAKAHGEGQEESLAEETTGARKVTIKNLGRENVVGLYPEGGAMIHAQDANSVVVAWDNEENNNGSAWRIVKVADPTTTSFDLTIGEAGYATLYLGCAVTIPAGVEAYVVSEIKDTYVNMTAVTGAIPANEAVILKKAEGQPTDATSYSFNYATSANAVEANLLNGTTIDTYVAGPAYVLSKPADSEVGLYEAALNADATGAATGETHFKNNAHKAYLAVTAEQAQNAASFSFRFDGTTGIENVEGQSEGTVVYDLMGRRVENPTRGIYVINGKKVLVK